ncbi:RNA recognition motif domain containing protein [Babesia bovis T2Bo]|uniref:RNA recognition motif domain containing protein n=1 Tax=Babesia bovis TaxID=5865 RepID=A7AMH0_BABBO|nr:RNA recognition motif domain containing protein [Babesia bovis T2Bo]EDO07754.1 RNA recognition motif domain containing protein [Babesia bovis T2Bo]|eukprot:XP_001611322.1 RNA recognition motif domain containing protein [Babesia bovis T2Bo]
MDNEEVPIKTIGGWVIIVTGVHPEAQEEDIRDAFEGFGQITSIHLNMDRRSGYAKGYAFIEFSEQQEARSAITEMNGHQILGQEVAVAWAFKDVGSNQ